MPLYDYRCKSCKSITSASKSIAERKVPCETPCETCGGEISLALLSAPKSVSGVENKDKRPSGWKDVLGKIKQSSGRHNTIDI